MRRFVCLAALLLGFSGERFVWQARLPIVVPAVRSVRLLETDGTVRGPGWWLA